MELETLKEKHRSEIEEFIKDCPHTDVIVEDRTPGFRQREITLRCARCRLNLLGYSIDGDWSYMSYVRDCVNGHPGSRGGKLKG